MGKAVSVNIQKGGVGKTTIAINLGSRLANRDHKVLLIDMDPQGHLTEGVGMYNQYENEKHIGQKLIDNKESPELKEIIQKGKRFDIIPSNKDLDEYKFQLTQESYGVANLRDKIVNPLLEEKYEYIVIDSPPSLDIYSDSALVASGNVVIPIETRESSLRGLEQMLKKQIQPLKQRIDLDILAIVPNKLSGDNEDKRVIEQLEENFDGYLPGFAKQNVDLPGIRQRIDISRAWKEGKPLDRYDPENDMIERFDELASIVENGGIQ